MDFKFTQVGVDFKSIFIQTPSMNLLSWMDFKSLLKSTHPSESLYSSTMADSDLAMEVKEEFMVSPMGGTCVVKSAFIMTCDALEPTGMEGQEDEVHESRFESDNMDDASGDDLEASDKPPLMHKPYHSQIKQLEAAFKECPHPDVNQRKEQVKLFWFQNPRTQMKKNSVLQQENDKLVAENMVMRVENARLKEQLDRTAAIVRSFLGRPLSAVELGVEADCPPAEAESIAPIGGDFGYRCFYPKCKDNTLRAQMDVVIFPQ